MYHKQSKKEEKGEWPQLPLGLGPWGREETCSIELTAVSEGTCPVSRNGFHRSYCCVGRDLNCLEVLNSAPMLPTGMKWSCCHPSPLPTVTCCPAPPITGLVICGELNKQGDNVFWKFWQLVGNLSGNWRNLSWEEKGEFRGHHQKLGCLVCKENRKNAGERWKGKEVWEGIKKGKPKSFRGKRKRREAETWKEGGVWNSTFLRLVSVLNFSFGAVIRRHCPWEPNIYFFLLVVVSCSPPRYFCCYFRIDSACVI